MKQRLKISHLSSLFSLLILFSLLLACADDPDPPNSTNPPMQPEITIFADGLTNPVGLAPLPNGRLLVAEEGTGEADNSAGVSVIHPDGRTQPLITGLPSGRDSGDLSGVPFVTLSPDGRTLYTSHFGLGHLYTLPTATFSPTLPARPFTSADLDHAMEPFNDVRLTNPFDLTFDPNGRPVVSDASQNGVAVPTADGRTQFIHRFDPLPDPANPDSTIDPVPTGIAAHPRNHGEYLVTLTGGCPYPLQGGRLVAIDGNRNQRTVVDNLNMPIDVTTDAGGDIWVLEFAQFAQEASCFSGAGYQPGTGRLSRVNPGGSFQPVLTGLSHPAGVTITADGTAYISELSAGRVLRITNLFAVNRTMDVRDHLPTEAAYPFAPVETANSASGGDGSVSADDSGPAESNPDVQPPQNAAVPDNALTEEITFTDVAAELGLDFTHGAFAHRLSSDPAAMMGAGLCWLDYDADGRLDLYLINSHAEDEAADWQAAGGLPHNRLYRQQADGTFADVSAATGTDLALRGNGCLAADLNNDTHPDLYVTADGPNALLWNNGDGTFTAGAAAAGVDAPEWNSAATAADLDRDGDLDLFVAAYIDLDFKIPNPSGAFPQDFYGLPDRLYLNNGDGTFTDVAAEVGLLRQERGLGALFSDLDNDNDVELYIANDGQPNRLYTAQADPAAPHGFRLVDLSLSAATGDSGSGMGVAGGDYDNDGRFDLFVTNWEAELNAVYRNEIDDAGRLQFRYSTYRIGVSGLGNGMTGWGTAWADFDNDTDQDLLVVNGRVPITAPESDAETIRYYRNRLAQGRPNQFREWTDRVGLGDDQLGRLMARGSAVADFDNDGDLDAAVNTIGGTAVLLRNDGANGRWLTVALDGESTGAMAAVTLPDGRTLVRQTHAGSSYLATEDPRLHFGLGTAEAVDLTIWWGDGTKTMLTDVAADQTVTVTPEQRAHTAVADSRVSIEYRSDTTPAEIAAQQPPSRPDQTTPGQPADPAVPQTPTTERKPDSQIAVDWFDLQLVLAEETPGFAPPVAARAFGYSGVALYEAIQAADPAYRSIADRLNGLDPAALPRIDPDQTYHWGTVANAALAYITRKMYPNMSGKNAGLVNDLEATTAAQFADQPAAVRDRSVAFGRDVAQAIYVWSLTDGGDGAQWRNFPPTYEPPTGPGTWQPTPPTFTAALLPYWRYNRPFVLDRADECTVQPPPPYSEDPDSEFYQQALAVYEAVNNLTAEQREIAVFWADDPGETPTPPGHSLSVLNQVLADRRPSLAFTAEAYARLGIGLADAFIGCWDTKYTHNLIRPITYIQQVIDPDWNRPEVTDPVTTPPFPEYTSGHSVQAGAAAEILTFLFGDGYAFTDRTHVGRGFASRSFGSFYEMADETAVSRLYGGIHYPMSNTRGVTEGRCIGGKINAVSFRVEE